MWLRPRMVEEKGYAKVMGYAWGGSLPQKSLTAFSLWELWPKILDMTLLPFTIGVLEVV